MARYPRDAVKRRSTDESHVFKCAHCDERILTDTDVRRMILTEGCIVRGREVTPPRSVSWSNGSSRTSGEHVRKNPLSDARHSWTCMRLGKPKTSESDPIGDPAITRSPEVGPRDR